MKKNNKNLKRVTFETSRKLEYFTKKEIEMQIGYGKEWWPIALIKELIDNNLDACETANIYPEIEIEIGNNWFSVGDNGMGIPDKTIKKSLDYLKRVSDKAFYVSPTRGQMGNALKVIWATPYINNGKMGVVEVWVEGKHHKISVTLDRIKQEPIIEHIVEKSDFIKKGTLFKIHGFESNIILEPKRDGFYKMPPKIHDVIESYSAFNPHAKFILRINNIEKVYEPTNLKWNKWKPNNPTSPHWYELETLRDLLAAYVTEESVGGRSKTIREFISEFRGLSGISKQKKIVPEEMKNMYLHDLIKEGDIDMTKLQQLHDDMKSNSKKPNPIVLGFLGKEHISEWMVKYAGCTEQSIKYNRKVGFDTDGLPYVVEIGFGIRKSDEDGRRYLTGLNWTTTLGIPTDIISEIIGEMRIDKEDPVTLLIHMAKPRFEYVDRGKTRLEL